MDEGTIGTEIRLFALESIVCQHLATIYQHMPPKVFDAVRELAIQGMMRQTFQGEDAARSNLLSAELEAAVDRLYRMIEHHLERARQIQRGEQQ